MQHMTTTKWMVKNGTFAVLEEDRSVLRGYMVVENDRITYLGEEEPVVEEGTEIIDGTHLFFLPGLVNTHGHAAMSLLRGYGDDLALQVWLQEKCGRWKPNSRQTTYIGAHRSPCWR